MNRELKSVCRNKTWHVAVLMLAWTFGHPYQIWTVLAQADTPDSLITNELRLEVSGNAASGNSTFHIIDSGLTFERRDSVYYELEARAYGRYGKTKQDVIASVFGAVFTFDATPYATFSPFSLTEIERNPIRKLELRARLGAGGKLMLMRRADKDKTSFSTAILCDFEQQETDGDTVGESALRLSFRLKRELKIGSKIDLSAAWFFQPRLNAFSDFLVNGLGEISLDLTETIDLKFSYNYFRDSDPPTGVKRSELRILYGVVGRF